VAVNNKAAVIKAAINSKATIVETIIVQMNRIKFFVA